MSGRRTPNRREEKTHFVTPIRPTFQLVCPDFLDGGISTARNMVRMSIFALMIVLSFWAEAQDLNAKSPAGLNIVQLGI